MNRTFKSLALALALLSPASVFAGPPDTGSAPGEHRRHRGGHRFYEVISQNADKLGITPATLAQIKAAFEAARPEAERLHQQMRLAHESGDQAKIEAARTAKKAHHEAMRAKIDGMLTEKQRAAIKELVGKDHPRHGKKPAPPTQ